MKGEVISLPKDRQVGISSEGAKKTKPIVSMDASAVPPKEGEGDK